MRILWVYAHPEPRSLNASLRDAGIDALTSEGHQVELSDLYAMDWRAALDRHDFGDLPDQPTEISRASKRAYQAGTLLPEIRAEQERLRWSDVLVLQFPLWWYSTPAILKGWIDRVFTKGFAYGIADPDHPGRTFRYGAGPLQGRRAQVLVSTGSPQAAMGPRGINGSLEQVLFHLLHGTLWYVGLEPLPPVAIHDADHLSAAAHADAVAQVRARMRELATVAAIPYRSQNTGDYDDDLVLHDHIAPGRQGIGVHRRDVVDASLRPSDGGGVAHDARIDPHAQGTWPDRSSRSGHR